MEKRDMFSWYRDLYPDVENSMTYSKYCTAAFGKDFSQQGFSDSEDIAFMLSQLRVKTDSHLLDIGCGSGKRDEFIHEQTGASIVGLDYSPAAIEIAKARAQAQHNLVFSCADMDTVDYPAGTFDIIFSIDSIFFSEDLSQLGCVDNRDMI